MASKKRKSTSNDDDDDKLSSKQPKINAFFTPRVSLSTTCGTDKTTSVDKLSEEQNTVLQLVVEEGKNVFFTGSAGVFAHTLVDALTVGTDTGTGKSLLLRAVISALRRKYANRPDYIAVTASTGMAASNIGGECGRAATGCADYMVITCNSGMTVHSWGAVTPGNNDIDAQIRCIRTCKPALQRWKNVKVMVIDESESYCMCVPLSVLISSVMVFQYLCLMDTCSIHWLHWRNVFERRRTSHLEAFRCVYPRSSSMLAHYP